MFAELPVEARDKALRFWAVASMATLVDAYSDPAAPGARRLLAHVGLAGMELADALGSKHDLYAIATYQVGVAGVRLADPEDWSTALVFLGFARRNGTLTPEVDDAFAGSMVSCRILATRAGADPSGTGVVSKALARPLEADELPLRIEYFKLDGERLVRISCQLAQVPTSQVASTGALCNELNYGLAVGKFVMATDGGVFIETIVPDSTLTISSLRDTAMTVATLGDQLRQKLGKPRGSRG